MHSRKQSRRAFLVEAITSTLLFAAGPSSAEDVPVQSNAELPAISVPQVQPPKPKPRRPTWGYSSENGPSKWASLSEDWELAATGTNQSPIPLSYRTAALQPATPDRPRLTTNPAKFSVKLQELLYAEHRWFSLEQYVSPPPPIVGDAPPVDVYTPPPIAALLVTPDGTYTLKSVHFHAGSTEHTLEGASGLMEIHFVFERRMRGAPASPAAAEEAASDPPPPEAETKERKKDAENEKTATAPKTIVVASMASKADASSLWFANVLKKFLAANNEDGNKSGIVIDLDMAAVLPEFNTSDLYTYSGSMTTPPCTEGIQWIIPSKRMSVSQSDVKLLIDMQGGPNIRPLQAVNDRRVTRILAP